MPLERPHPFVRSDLFGGRGQVQIWNLMSSTPLPPFTTALWCSLEPGADVGRHRQEEDAELVICISGNGTAQVDDDTHPLRPGSLVQLPLGAILALRNHDRDHPLEYLILKASPEKKSDHVQG